MRDKLISVIEHLIKYNHKIIIILDKVTVTGFKEIKEKYPERVLKIETNTSAGTLFLINMAAGMMLSGMYPFVYTSGCFLTENVFEQIKAISGYQTERAGIVLISKRMTPDDLPFNIRFLQSSADVTLLNTLDNWKLIVPENRKEMDMALHEIATNTGFYYVRLPA
ncbi:hypothetical protein RIX35_005185 [Salmonella enterica]|uniref:Thiamine pyrophosphate enzyme N-terminal TPP-binding domain-containing protein n=1 Tax=Salmonella enterica TaxID=28901 RepID=A0A403T708_SALER|nr:hypothetical protein [Salmonella enterica]MMS79584.1 hypothetical protein [Salmonella enterica]